MSSTGILGTALGRQHGKAGRAGRAGRAFGVGWAGYLGPCSVCTQNLGILECGYEAGILAPLELYSVLGALHQLLYDNHQANQGHPLLSRPNKQRWLSSGSCNKKSGVITQVGRENAGCSSETDDGQGLGLSGVFLTVVPVHLANDDSPRNMVKPQVVEARFCALDLCILNISSLSLCNAPIYTPNTRALAA